MNNSNSIVTISYDSVYEKAYLNIPIIDFLRQGADILCVGYDFDGFDVANICDLAHKPDPAERTFIWLCRVHGTNYCSEREVFIKNTRSHDTLVACATPFVSAYALLVEITGENDGQPIGNIYRLNLAEFAREVQMKAIWQKAHKVTYQDGHTQTFSLDANISWYRDHGHVVSDEPIPESEAALAQVLDSYKNRRRECVEAAMKENGGHE